MYEHHSTKIYDQKCHGTKTQHIEIQTLQVLGTIPVVQAGKRCSGQNKQSEQSIETGGPKTGLRDGTDRASLKHYGEEMHGIQKVPERTVIPQ